MNRNQHNPLKGETKMKKAIVYVSDIILGRTGEIISREQQKAQIQKFAADNDIEIVAWFEDEIYAEDVFARPGFQRMLSCKNSCDIVLVERIWALSRNLSTLERIFDEIEARIGKVEAATTLWDCASQLQRRRFHESANRLYRPREVVVRSSAEKVSIRKPEKLNFVTLKKTTA